MKGFWGRERAILGELWGVPEVRRLMWIAWLNGFTFGALTERQAGARLEAEEAIRLRYPTA